MDNNLTSLFSDVNNIKSTNNKLTVLYAKIMYSIIESCPSVLIIDDSFVGLMETYFKVTGMFDGELEGKTFIIFLRVNRKHESVVIDLIMDKVLLESLYLKTEYLTCDNLYKEIVDMFNLTDSIKNLRRVINGDVATIDNFMNYMKDRGWKYRFEFEFEPIIPNKAELIKDNIKLKYRKMGNVSFMTVETDYHFQNMACQTIEVDPTWTCMELHNRVERIVEKLYMVLKDRRS